MARNKVEVQKLLAEKISAPEKLLPLAGDDKVRSLRKGKLFKL